MKVICKNLNIVNEDDCGIFRKHKNNKKKLKLKLKTSCKQKCFRASFNY